MYNDDDDDGRVCHHFRLIFTDGACRQNGQLGATAGIGIARGEKAASQQAIPITRLVDENSKRTSQRAELLAALAGLEHMVEVDRLNAGNENKLKKQKKTKGRKHGLRDAEKALIIATDSEYVVKGMTEWLPAWKVSPLYSFYPFKDFSALNLH